MKEERQGCVLRVSKGRGHGRTCSVLWKKMATDWWKKTGRRELWSPSSLRYSAAYSSHHQS
jgi:hypothetical protein